MIENWDSLPEDALVRLKVMIIILGISKSTAYSRMATDPDFPKPICLGKLNKRGAIRYRKGDIMVYLKTLAERSADPHRRELQKSKGGRKKNVHK